MNQNLRLALAQINTTVGDLSGNSQKIVEFAQKAAKSGADIIVFPELCLTGYPPEDLLLKKHFIQDNLAALHSLAKKIDGISAQTKRLETIYQNKLADLEALKKSVLKKAFAGEL